MRNQAGIAAVIDSMSETGDEDVAVTSEGGGAVKQEQRMVPIAVREVRRLKKQLAVLEDQLTASMVWGRKSLSRGASSLRSSLAKDITVGPAIKRPPEPPIELHLHRTDELALMISQGREDAEEAALQAGFLGGNSQTVIWLHAIVVLYAVTITFYLSSVLVVNREPGKRLQELIAFIWNIDDPESLPGEGYLISMSIIYCLFASFIALIFSWRGYFLLIDKPLLANLVIVFGCPPLVFFYFIHIAQWTMIFQACNDQHVCNNANILPLWIAYFSYSPVVVTVVMLWNYIIVGDRVAAQNSARFLFFWYGIGGIANSLSSSTSYLGRLNTGLDLGFADTILGFFIFAYVSFVRTYALISSGLLVEDDVNAYSVFWNKTEKRYLDSDGTADVEGGDGRSKPLDVLVRDWNQWMEHDVIAAKMKKKKRICPKGPTKRLVKAFVRYYIGCISPALFAEVNNWLHYEVDPDGWPLPKLVEHLQAKKMKEKVDEEEEEEEDAQGHSEHKVNEERKPTKALVAVVPEETVVNSTIVKSPHIIDGIRRIHDSSRVAKLPWNKPRQIVPELAILFAQAGELNDHFQEKLKYWAGEAGGSLPSSDLPVKRRRRAIEKLWRTYGGDAARLIDLCRGAIRLETPADLARCVQLILEDPHCGVLQIKNRLTKKHNPLSSAGYRNVSLSLIIVDEYTMSRGIDAHVCELQLGLGPFEDLKYYLDGHARYVKFRNSRAE